MNEALAYYSAFRVNVTHLGTILARRTAKGLALCCPDGQTVHDPNVTHRTQTRGLVLKRFPITMGVM